MDLNTINRNNINFDNNSFDKVDSEISNKLLPAVCLIAEFQKEKEKEIEQFWLMKSTIKLGSGKNAFSLSWKQIW